MFIVPAEANCACCALLSAISVTGTELCSRIVHLDAQGTIIMVIRYVLLFNGWHRMWDDVNLCASASSNT